MNDESQEQIDITRLNRKERRNIGKQVKEKIYGRNLPYKKYVPDEQKQGKMRYMPISEFNMRREAEIATEKKAREQQLKEQKHEAK